MKHETAKRKPDKEEKVFIDTRKKLKYLIKE